MPRGLGLARTPLITSQKSRHALKGSWGRCSTPLFRTGGGGLRKAVRKLTDSVGLKISGWTVGAKSRRLVRQIIVTADGKIVGFGGLGFERRDVVAALHSRRALLSGWIGFAQAPVSAGVPEVYGQVNASGAICEVARVPVPRP